jgi:hypothetical protein
MIGQLLNSDLEMTRKNAIVALDNNKYSISAVTPTIVRGAKKIYTFIINTVNI